MRSVIRIKNRGNDEISSASVIVTGIARIENDPNYKSIRQSYGKQTDYARALNKEVGVPFGKCGFEEIKRFENTRRMQNYKVMVISKENLNAIIYVGPEDREHMIYLYSHDLVTSLSAFYQKSYFAKSASKAMTQNQTTNVKMHALCVVVMIVPLQNEPCVWYYTLCKKMQLQSDDSWLTQGQLSVCFPQQRLIAIIHQLSIWQQLMKHPFKRTDNAQSLDLGLKRCFRWIFILADTPTPILGANFLHNFALIVDVARGQLIDKTTNLFDKGVATMDTPINPVFAPPDSGLLDDILREFPQSLSHYAKRLQWNTQWHITSQQKARKRGSTYIHDWDPLLSIIKNCFLNLYLNVWKIMLLQNKYLWQVFVTQHSFTNILCHQMAQYGLIQWT